MAAASKPAKKATESKPLKKVAKVKFTLIHKLAAGVSLLAFVVILAAGIRAQAGVTTIAFRACLAILAVGIISRIVTGILATSEEMNSGKA